ncbi:MAG TPA: histidine phosphatase family protein [Verrucomicrobiae bacterium]|nr:histidine phosphatase family protein [Verrucomicrobiae bacterium]
MVIPFKLQKVVYLVRHGQSEGNTSPVFQSFKSPLSTKGKEQANRVASRFEHLDFEVLISSPQVRAQQTAAAIATKASKPIERSDLFVEWMKPKSIDGKPVDDIQANTTWRAWQKA